MPSPTPGEVLAAAEEIAERFVSTSSWERTPEELLADAKDLAEAVLNRPVTDVAFSEDGGSILFHVAPDPVEEVVVTITRTAPDAEA